MKKLALAVVAVLVASAVASQADDVFNVDTVNSHTAITIKGKLSDKTKITEADLAPAGVSNGVLEVINYTVGSQSNRIVIGTITTTIDTNATPNVTNNTINATGYVFVTGQLNKNQIIAGMGLSAKPDTNNNDAVNGFLLVTGKVDDTKGTVSLKATGIWSYNQLTGQDGVAVKATIKNAKKTKTPKTKK